jgi:uncharacterized membrane protein
VNSESSRNFETNKILGGVGALLTAIGSFVPFAGPVGIVSIIGIILLLISMKGLSENFREPNIWRNAINGFIFGIIGIGIAIVIFAIFLFSMFSSARFFWVPGVVFSFVGLIIGLVIVFAFFLLEAIFYKRAFDLLGTRSGERMFHTGGLLLLIGAVLTIVVIGFVLLFVAWLLIAIAFFSMRAQIQQTSRYATQPPSSAPSTFSGQVQYCQYCGAENKMDATFCTHCGRRLTQET